MASVWAPGIAVPDVYVNEICTFKKQLEEEYAVDPTYLDAKHTDRSIRSSHRALTVSWLFQLSHTFHLRPDTFFLTIQLLDMFLQQKSITVGQLQLYACVCMYLACKQEEIYYPEQRDFVYSGDGAFTLKEFIASEHVAIDVLAFNLAVPTCLTFFGIFFHRFERFCANQKGAVIQEDDLQQVHKLGILLLYCSMKESTFLAFKPSTRAAVALGVAMACENWFNHCKQQNGAEHRPFKFPPMPEIHRFTGYSMSELQACFSDTYTLLATERCIHKLDTKDFSDTELILCSVNEHYNADELETIQRLRLFIKNKETKNKSTTLTVTTTT